MYSTCSHIQEVLQTSMGPPGCDAVQRRTTQFEIIGCESPSLHPELAGPGPANASWLASNSASDAAHGPVARNASCIQLSESDSRNPCDLLNTHEIPASSALSWQPSIGKLDLQDLRAEGSISWLDGLLTGKVIKVRVSQGKWSFCSLIQTPQDTYRVRQHSQPSALCTWLSENDAVHDIFPPLSDDRVIVQSTLS